ncbi:putative phage membrane protein [Vibrio chagasii]|nr:putative phage membrane protein [Vibrio chagasii]
MKISVRKAFNRIDLETFLNEKDNVNLEIETYELMHPLSRSILEKFLKQLELMERYISDKSLAVHNTELELFLSSLDHLSSELHEQSSDAFNLKAALHILRKLFDFNINDINPFLNKRKKSQLDEFGLFSSMNNEQRNEIYHKINEMLSQQRSDAIKDLNKHYRDNLENIQNARWEAEKSITLGVNEEISAIQSRIDEEVGKFSKKQQVMDQYFERLGIAKEGEAYILQANKERFTANLLRFIGILGMIGAIVLLGYLFKDYLGIGRELTKEYIANLKSLGNEIFILRFLSVVLITAPSIYLLKEAATHRTKENLYRQRGTQLVSINSYMDGLDKEDKSKLKLDLAKNFFSFHDGKSDTKNVPDFIRDMKEAVGIAKSINAQTKTVSQRFNRKVK